MTTNEDFEAALHDKFKLINGPATRELITAIQEYVDSHPTPEVSMQRRASGKGCNYKKCIGRFVRPDGKSEPKVFWLGSHQGFARRAASYLHAVYEMDRKCGDSNWSPSVLASVERAFEFVQNRSDHRIGRLRAIMDNVGPSITIPTQATPIAPTVTPTTALTLVGVVKLYEDSKLPADMSSEDRGHANASRHISGLNVFKRFVADAPTIVGDSDKAVGLVREQFKYPSAVANGPMENIGYEQLFAFAANLKNRRLSGYAPDTILTTMRIVVAFLRWCEESGKWKASCNYERLLKVQKGKLATMAESKKIRSGQATFTIDELKALYAKSEKFPRWRLYLLLGLNLVSTQQQISDLLVDDVIELIGKSPAVNFIRGKTRHINKGAGVEGRYPLWPETVAALQGWLKSNPPRRGVVNVDGVLEQKLLSTEDGHDLVRYNSGKLKSSKTDSVKQCWERLLSCAGADRKKKKAGPVRWLGFKHLRKTSADAIKQMAGGGATGEYFQQLALASAATSVAAHHYSGSGSADADFATLAGYIGRLRTEVFKDVFPSTVAN